MIAETRTVTKHIVAACTAAGFIPRNHPASRRLCACTAAGGRDSRPVISPWDIVASVLPVYLLIVAGAVLRRTG